MHRALLGRAVALLLLAGCACGYHGGTPNGNVHGSVHGNAQSGIVSATAGESCQALKEMGNTASGVYWLKPAGVSKAFKGYCDMDTFGGGWLVCYTSKDGVNMRTEKSSSVAYPSNGYRSDCMNYAFNEIMYINHDSANDKAWFSFDGADGRQDDDFEPHPFTHAVSGAEVRRGDHSQFAFKAISSSRTNVNGNPWGRGPSTSWSGHGSARKIVTASGAVTDNGKQKYQLVVCDTGSNAMGFFMSGITDAATPRQGASGGQAGGRCYKSCDSWCNDLHSDWYRHSSSSGSGNSERKGVSFKENGMNNRGNKKVSVAIRFRTNEPYHWAPPHY